MSERDAMVFVVDDDAPMRESLKNLIRSVGLRVELFASAQEFLRSKRPDLPSCLVLDVRLPGLSGLDLQKRTRLKYYGINYAFNRCDRAGQSGL
jgi:FixJ family two-component response regulator